MKNKSDGTFNITELVNEVPKYFRSFRLSIYGARSGIKGKGKRIEK